MRYPRSFRRSIDMPKSIGCYEDELHEYIDYFIRQSPVEICNVGSAEGYYAVGMALACPETRVYAYDVCPKEAKRCRHLAEINCVSDRVVCSESDGLLHIGQLRAGTLVICDCEGAERRILEADLAPSLKYCNVIIELHDGCGYEFEEFRLSFVASHDAIIVNEIAVPCRSYGALKGLPPLVKALLTNERRMRRTSWLILRSKERQHSPGNSFD